MKPLSRAGQLCSICSKGKLVVISQSDSGVQYKCDSCGGYHADAFGFMNAASSLSKLKAKSGKTVVRRPPKVGTHPTKELEHLNKGSSQLRYLLDRSNRRTVFFQIAYTPDSRIKHIDCKKCGNKWYLASRTDVKNYFAIKGDKIGCLRCKRETSMSSV